MGSGCLPGLHWNTGSKAEELLKHADKKAWLGNWTDAAPEYRQAEVLFDKSGDQVHALYAHVSQLVPEIQTTSMPILIGEIAHSLATPAARSPEVRLRILTVKGMAELNYDAAIARTTWNQVEKLANRLHQYRLALRACGEQGILAFLLGDISDAKARVTKAYTWSWILNDPAARVRYASVYGNALVELHKYQESLRWLDEAIHLAERTPGLAQPTIAYNAKVDALSALGRNQEAQQLAEKVLRISEDHHAQGQQYAVRIQPCAGAPAPGGLAERNR
jgi:tetratricopeptide (TPR) repeat protein